MVLLPEREEGWVSAKQAFSKGGSVIGTCNASNHKDGNWSRPSFPRYVEIFKKWVLSF